MATVTLLQLKSDFFRLMLEHWSGTATGGSTTSLVDTSLVGFTSEVWPTKFEGQQLRVTSGSAINDLRQIGRFERDEGTLRPNRAFSAAVANTDTYELWGTAIHGGVPLTNLFNDVMRGLRPITETQVTIVTNQTVYDITTTAQTKRDVRSVYLRLLDPANVMPYTVRELVPGLNYSVYDRGGAGTTSVVLELRGALTRDDNTIQMWLRAATTFTAFSTTVDTGTVDAVYRNWLVLEALLYFSTLKAAQNISDKGRWQGLRDWVMDQRGGDLPGWRNRWEPREPMQVATFQDA